MTAPAKPVDLAAIRKIAALYESKAPNEAATPHLRAMADKIEAL